MTYEEAQKLIEKAGGIKDAIGVTALVAIMSGDREFDPVVHDNMVTAEYGRMYRERLAKRKPRKSKPAKPALGGNG